MTISTLLVGSVFALYLASLVVTKVKAVRARPVNV